MPISRVYQICVAYETGVGHGKQRDGKTAPYGDPEYNEAYEYGYEAGVEMADEQAAREGVKDPATMSYPKRPKTPREMEGV